MKTLLRLFALAAIALTGLMGCVAQPDYHLVDEVYRGEIGRARQYLKDKIGGDLQPGAGAGAKNPDRDFVLNRMRLGLVTLGDGYAPGVPTAWDDVFAILRKAALNKNMQVPAVLLNEDLKIWKGEPFEQALAYGYVGLHYASNGSWDNALAAVKNSLFPLKAVAGASAGSGVSTVQAVESSNLDHPHDVETNFTLGYLMTGVAAIQQSRAVGDPDLVREANENFNRALRLDPQLAGVIRALSNPDSYNTVLVVDYGRGPQKIATGPDNAIASFRPLVPSDNRPIVVSSESEIVAYPPACDVNAMAQDHVWNDLQDMRVAKSYLGTALLAGGAATSIIGADNHNTALEAAGLGMMLAGAIAKGGAHADTRYCELMPQRIYVVPVKINHAGSTVSVEVSGVPSSKLALAGLAPPAGRAAQLRYIRLPSNPYGGYVDSWPAPPWTTSGTAVYGNDYAPQAGRVHLPYILGGDSVASPTQAALESYQAAGYLRGMTVEELRHLYTAEGIKLSAQEEKGVPGLHILEGGKSMETPLPGTVGYARLFCIQHPPYNPVSQEVKTLRDQLQNQTGAANK